MMEGRAVGHSLYQCTVCLKYFNRESQRDRHLRSHAAHTVFPCSVCGRPFRHQAALLKHSTVHIQDKLKSFECDQCEKKYAQHNHLLLHRRIHRQLLACTLCKQGFSKKNELTWHMSSTHHQGNSNASSPQAGLQCDARHTSPRSPGARRGVDKKCNPRSSNGHQSPLKHGTAGHVSGSQVTSYQKPWQSANPQCLFGSAGDTYVGEQTAPACSSENEMRPVTPSSRCNKGGVPRISSFGGEGASSSLTTVPRTPSPSSIIPRTPSNTVPGTASPCNIVPRTPSPRNIVPRTPSPRKTVHSTPPGGTVPGTASRNKVLSGPGSARSLGDVPATSGVGVEVPNSGGVSSPPSNDGTGTNNGNTRHEIVIMPSNSEDERAGLGMSGGQCFSSDRNGNLYSSTTQQAQQSVGTDGYFTPNPSCDYIPSGSNTDYVVPSVASNEYVAPMVSGSEYVVPNVSDSDYVITTGRASSDDYIVPDVSSENDVVRNVSRNEYVVQSVSSNGYEIPSVSINDYGPKDIPSHDFVVQSVLNNRCAVRDIIDNNPDSAEVPTSGSMNPVVSSGSYVCPMPRVELSRLEPGLGQYQGEMEPGEGCHSTDAPGPFSCSICGKSFGQQASLDRHCQASHSIVKNSRQYQCGSCQRSYSHMSSLNKHARIAHPEKVKQHKCDVCGASFFWLKSLTWHCKAFHPKDHLDTVHSYACAVCGDVFGRPVELRRHTRKHFVPEEYRCEYCPLIFSKRPSKLAHIRKRHADQVYDTQNKRYHCDRHCGKFFRFHQAMRDHVLQDHVGVASPVGRYNFRGTDCVGMDLEGNQAAEVLLAEMYPVKNEMNLASPVTAVNDPKQLLSSPQGIGMSPVHQRSGTDSFVIDTTVQQANEGADLKRAELQASRPAIIMTSPDMQLTSTDTCLKTILGKENRDVAARGFLDRLSPEVGQSYRNEETLLQTHIAETNTGMRGREVELTTEVVSSNTHQLRRNEPYIENGTGDVGICDQFVPASQLTRDQGETWSSSTEYVVSKKFLRNMSVQEPSEDSLAARDLQQSEGLVSPVNSYPCGHCGKIFKTMRGCNQHVNYIYKKTLEGVSMVKEAASTDVPRQMVPADLGETQLSERIESVQTDSAESPAATHTASRHHWSDSMSSPHSTAGRDGSPTTNDQNIRRSEQSSDTTLLNISSAQNPCYCTFCKRTFNSRRGYKIHVAHKHGKMLADIDKALLGTELVSTGAVLHAAGRPVAMPAPDDGWKEEHGMRQHISQTNVNTPGAAVSRSRISNKKDDVTPDITNMDTTMEPTALDTTQYSVVPIKDSSIFRESAILDQYTSNVREAAISDQNASNVREAAILDQNTSNVREAAILDQNDSNAREAAILDQNASNVREAAILDQNASNVREAAILDQNASNVREAAILDQNASNVREAAILDQNASNAREAAILDQNASNVREAAILDQNASNVREAAILDQNASNVSTSDQITFNVREAGVFDEIMSSVIEAGISEQMSSSVRGAGISDQITSIVRQAGITDQIASIVREAGITEQIASIVRKASISEQTRGSVTEGGMSNQMTFRVRGAVMSDQMTSTVGKAGISYEIRDQNYTNPTAGKGRVSCVEESKGREYSEDLGPMMQADGEGYHRSSGTELRPPAESPAHCNISQGTVNYNKDDMRLTKQVKARMATRKASYQCVYCARSFPSLRGYNIHTKKHGLELGSSDKLSDHWIQMAKGPGMGMIVGTEKTTKSAMERRVHGEARSEVQDDRQYRAIENMGESVSKGDGSNGRQHRSLENMGESVSKGDGSNGRQRRSLENMGESVSKGDGSNGRQHRSFENMGESVSKGDGSNGSQHRSLENMGESVSKGDGSNGRQLRSLENMGESVSKDDGSNTRQHRSVENMGESVSKDDGSNTRQHRSVENMGESVSKDDGSNTRQHRSVENMGESVSKDDGSNTRQHRSVENMGESVSKDDGSNTRQHRSVENMGESVSKDDGSNTRQHRSVENMGESVSKDDGSNTRQHRSVENMGESVSKDDGGTEGKLQGSHLAVIDQKNKDSREESLKEELMSTNIAAAEDREIIPSERVESAASAPGNVWPGTEGDKQLESKAMQGTQLVYTCPECRRTFKSNKGCKIHMTQKHRNTVDSAVDSRVDSAMDFQNTSHVSQSQVADEKHTGLLDISEHQLSNDNVIRDDVAEEMMSVSAPDLSEKIGLEDPPLVLDASDVQAEMRGTGQNNLQAGKRKSEDNPADAKNDREQTHSIAKRAKYNKEPLDNSGEKSGRSRSKKRPSMGKSHHCSKCARCFGYHGNLEKHILRIHGDMHTSKIAPPMRTDPPQNAERLECDSSDSQREDKQTAHSRTSHSLKSLGCSLCKKHFQYNKSLKRHMENVHGTTRMDLPDAEHSASNSLDLPDAEVSTSSSMELPNAEHSASNSLDLPDAEVSTSSSMELPNADAEDSTGTGKDDSEYREHYKTPSSRSSKMTCSHTSTPQEHINSHVSSLQCAFCEQSFRRPKNLRKHMSRKHRRRPSVAKKRIVSQFHCSTCQATFTSKTAQYRHMCRMLTRIKDKTQNDSLTERHQYSCKKCHRQFRRAVTLKEHLAREHDAITLERCIPSRGATNPWKGRTRAASRHSQSEQHLSGALSASSTGKKGESNYHCMFCDDSFCTKVFLDLHMSDCHAEAQLGVTSVTIETNQQPENETSINKLDTSLSQPTVNSDSMENSLHSGSLNQQSEKVDSQNKHQAAVVMDTPNPVSGGTSEQDETSPITVQIDWGRVDTRLSPAPGQAGLDSGSETESAKSPNVSHKVDLKHGSKRKEEIGSGKTDLARDISSDLCSSGQNHRPQSQQEFEAICSSIQYESCEICSSFVDVLQRHVVKKHMADNQTVSEVTTDKQSVLPVPDDIDQDRGEHLDTGSQKESLQGNTLASRIVNKDIQLKPRTPISPHAGGREMGLESSIETSASSGQDDSLASCLQEPSMLSRDLVTVNLPDDGPLPQESSVLNDEPASADSSSPDDSPESCPQELGVHCSDVTPVDSHVPVSCPQESSMLSSELTSDPSSPDASCQQESSVVSSDRACMDSQNSSSLVDDLPGYQDENPVVEIDSLNQKNTRTSDDIPVQGNHSTDRITAPSLVSSEPVEPEEEESEVRLATCSMPPEIPPGDSHVDASPTGYEVCLNVEGVNAIRCQDCALIFADKSELNIHRFIKHLAVKTTLQTKIRYAQVQCNKCELTFSEMEELLRHDACMHKPVVEMTKLEESEEMSYCEQCDCLFYASTEDEHICQA